MSSLLAPIILAAAATTWGGYASREVPIDWKKICEAQNASLARNLTKEIFIRFQTAMLPISAMQMNVTPSDFQQADMPTMYRFVLAEIDARWRKQLVNTQELPMREAINPILHFEMTLLPNREYFSKMDCEK